MVGAVAFQEAQSEIVNRKANYPREQPFVWEREGRKWNTVILEHTHLHISPLVRPFTFFIEPAVTLTPSQLSEDNTQAHRIANDTQSWYILSYRAKGVDWKLSWHLKLLLPLSCWEPRKLSLHPAWFMSGCYELVTELQMNGNEAMLWEWTISSISHGTGSHRPVFAQSHSQCIVTADTKGSEEPSFTAFVFIS